MLRAVLVDFVKALAHRQGAPHSGQQGTVAANVLPKLHYSTSVPTMMQTAITRANASDVMNICKAIELENQYIPSGFKWALEHARFQVHMLNGNRAEAIQRIRAAIGQAPYRTDLIEEYRRTLARPTTPADIALVISCKKYESRALQLAKQLEAAGIDFRIVTGSDTQPIAHERAMQVQVSDAYEALPRKTAAALTWVYEQAGSNMGVIKLDDDQTVVDPEKLRAKVSYLHEIDAYAGVPVSGETHDRNWHWNKCRDPELNKRTYGRPYFRPWAKGGAYYLGPGPLEKVVISLIRYPGLFEGEYYEDKLVGDTLMHENVDLVPLGGYDEFGLLLAEQHRFNPSAVPA